MDGKKVKIYSFYNNKGGVGKTTLCSNAATLYAEKHPNTQVLVIDMCPQANISHFLLGGGKKGYLSNQKIQTHSSRKNIVGFIDWLLKGNASFTSINTSYRVNVSKHNNNMATNLYLIAGDSFLESLSLALNYAVINPANMLAWREYMTAIKRLTSFEFDEEKYENLVVFIDCNPSFSIYTQMALASSDYLIIPMMADYSSIDGIKGIFTMLYDEYPSAALKKYAENIITFNKQVKAHDLRLPLIYEFVFNNYTTHQGVANAYGAIKEELIDFCYSQQKQFPQYFCSTVDEITNRNDWAEIFISDVKDFHTAGKVSSSLGIPITKLPMQTTYTMPNYDEVRLPKSNYEQAVVDVAYFVSKIG